MAQYFQFIPVMFQLCVEAQGSRLADPPLNPAVLAGQSTIASKYVL
jgi:hypothetical protein